MLTECDLIELEGLRRRVVVAEAELASSMFDMSIGRVGLISLIDAQAKVQKQLDKFITEHTGE